MPIFRSFTSLCYSANGEYILAGGQSKNVCIYNVKESLLIKKFEITQNRSFDAVDVSYKIAALAAFYQKKTFTIGNFRISSTEEN